MALPRLCVTKDASSTPLAQTLGRAARRATATIGRSWPSITLSGLRALAACAKGSFSDPFTRTFNSFSSRVNWSVQDTRCATDIQMELEEGEGEGEGKIHVTSDHHRAVPGPGRSSAY